MGNNLYRFFRVCANTLCGMFHAGKGKRITAFHLTIHVFRMTLICTSGCSFLAYFPHFEKIKYAHEITLLSQQVLNA
jgi:hypothetical protein